MKQQSAAEMRLKAQVNNRAKAFGIPPIVAMQNFMFERFLHRLSRSPYRENFVLKGGVLISQLFGLDLRTTMDIDTTAVRLPLDSALRCVGEICSVDVGDGIAFAVRGGDGIRKDDLYGGVRAKLSAMTGRMSVQFYIDITTGDEITPAPADYLFRSAFDEETAFLVKGYPVETVIAEKLETFLRLGIANTRPKDLYDLYRLYERGFNAGTLADALVRTARHRGSESVLAETTSRFAKARDSEEIARQWKSYQSAHGFAEPVALESVFYRIARLLDIHK